MAKNEIVPFDKYALAKRGVKEVAALIKSNLGRNGISAFDLDRIKCPTGGGINMTIPDLEEGEKSVKQVDGIILFWKEPRAYWAKSIDDGGSGNPPDCSSEDSERGTGDPGGNCDDCAMAQFGSAKEGKGKGQACKQMIQAFVLRPDELLPIVVNLPPTSIQNARKYFLRLSGKMLPYYEVITKITLEKAANADGIDYSKFNLAFGGNLEKKQVEMITQVRESMMPSLRARKSTQEDFKQASKE